MDFSILSGLRPQARPLVSGITPPGIAELRAYWEALRCDGGIPARSEIDPRGISGALDRVFLAERMGTGLAQIRIAGTALSDIAGIDPRGLPLSCLFAPDARARLAGVLERLFDGPMAADLQVEAQREPGRLLMLPLCDATGARTLLIGCLALHRAGGRAPRRLDILHAVEERLLPARKAGRAMAGVPAVPHLRLVHSAG